MLKWAAGFACSPHPGRLCLIAKRRSLKASPTLVSCLRSSPKNSRLNHPKISPAPLCQRGERCAEKNSPLKKGERGGIWVRVRSLPSLGLLKRTSETKHEFSFFTLLETE